MAVIMLDDEDAPACTGIEQIVGLVSAQQSSRRTGGVG
jgi:hypothetical protein